MKHGVTNTGRSPMYVAGQMIPPGETRHFDLRDLPPELRPAAPGKADEPPAENALEVLRARKVAEVVAALPDLSSKELADLDLLELADPKPRKGVLEAIAADVLRRSTEQTPD